MRVFLRLGAVAALVFAVACGQSSPAGSGSAAGGSSGSVGASGGAFGVGGGAGASADASTDAPENGGGVYPSGPYGTQTGDVLANLTLLGYVRDATTGLAYEAALAPTSFADIRASTQKQHAVFHVSGFT